MITACGASEEVHDKATNATGEGTTTYPLTIDNCGVTETFDAAPDRVVSLDQGSTEILLSLGLADRMVGTASWTDPIRENLAQANSTVPRLADNAPGFAAVMDTDPDFVTASFGRHFKKEGGVAERARFAESSVPTYLSPTDCDGDISVNANGGKRTKPFAIDSLYEEITQLAAIFDVPSRGETLVNDIKKRIADAQATANGDGRTIAFWFADTKTPYVGGGMGSVQYMSDLLGLKNVYADLTDDWPATTWTSVVERNPDILGLGDLARNRFPGDKLADKEEFLATDPVTKAMPVVTQKRYIPLHGAEMNPSIRMIDGIEKMSAWLAQNPQ
ncbi:ABC transporter substrate-binding protein [Gordonia sp. NB41Y]|uniref:ABC transporter substrate-binding protein n=1 Tax=Gordonia sp. NB41Y TaxID=875808 RepID=UPI0002BE7C49|nr:ABC transporter substrate-binding protein [Gordonia sp. NB41Y]WLP90698.1 ABC transporter substrate-binding protein [Gordonia sp. NB41Y]